jgi:diguanylate cyclase (GGDEF)-like protein
MFDVSGRKETEEKLTWMSYYDELTDLPNRRLFTDRVGQATAVCRREQRSLALLYLDIDRFKFINDTLGHSIGDKVLQEVAVRIQQSLRETDTVARMGGDEFTVLLPGADVNTAMRVARKLGGALQRSLLMGEQNLALAASIGIAVFPNDGKNGEELLKHADIAMYHAKTNQLHIHCFSSSMEEQAVRRLRMEQDLARAVDGKQLELYYQGKHALGDRLEASPFPLHYQAKHRLDDDNIFGVEALIRWNHPELGMVSPAEFIPLAEESGLIHSITRWALAEAGYQAIAWEKACMRPGRIGVNISAIQLMQKVLAKEILARIREAGAKPEWIEIEITETAVMREPEIAITIMRELAEAGISIAIDDFGTGYSSLAYLKRLPAEWLKIDMAFIRNLPDDEEDSVIVRSTIAMAHALGMKVIAEGVEKEAQLEFLRNEGCDAVQGYLFSKPLPAARASAYIRNYLKS